jgi:predicted acylesterase/phospholipase RssA
MEQEKIPNRISSPIAFGEAQNFKIWEVARAATAAPTIFEPIKIKHQPNSANGKLKEYHTFSDGGFMGVNNPTMEVYREVEKRHGTQNGATISIVVSIGTARAGPRRFNTSVRGTARFAVDETTGTDRVAADMEELANRTPELRYFRLNATKKGCKVQLDEWKPRGVKARLKNQHPGSETLKSIDETFDTWYNETPSNGEKSNRQQISECAERLVKIRRARMKERSRWERYATCAHYYCDEVNCEAEFQYRHLFEKHLSEHNGTDAEEATPALYKEDNEDIEQDVGSEHGEGINEAITPTRSRQVQMDECRKRWEYPRKLGPNEGRYG